MIEAFVNNLAAYHTSKMKSDIIMENLFLLGFRKCNTIDLPHRLNKIGDLAENGIQHIFTLSLFSPQMSDVIRPIAVDKFSFTI